MKIVSSFVLLALAAVTALAGDTADHTNAPGFKNVIRAKYPLRILLSNDDSWASANIRATYYALKTAGHNVLMVSPVVNQSGKGGTVVLPGTPTLTTPGRDNSVAAGAPYAGAEPFDAGITYVNATPAGSVLFGLDQVGPKYAPFGGKLPQLTVSGPNEGQNLGPFLYTLSGTVGASYVSVERSIPAIAFSANTTPRDFNKVVWNDERDEAIIVATNTANLVSALTYVTNKNDDPIVPLGLGASVNYGNNVTTAQCPKVNWKQTRMTGGAYVDKIVINPATNLPTYQNIVSPGTNTCYNGDCRLQGEQDFVNQDPCAGAVTIYSVDYDAPTSAYGRAAPHFSQSIKGLNAGSLPKRNRVARQY